MNKAEFVKKSSQLKAKIDKLTKEKDELLVEFRRGCEHTEVTVTRNTYDDEYGRHMEAWDDFDYVCVDCRTRFCVDQLYNNHGEVVAEMKRINGNATTY